MKYVTATIAALAIAIMLNLAFATLAFACVFGLGFMGHATVKLAYMLYLAVTTSMMGTRSITAIATLARGYDSTVRIYSETPPEADANK